MEGRHFCSFHVPKQTEQTASLIYRTLVWFGLVWFGLGWFGLFTLLPNRRLSTSSSTHLCGARSKLSACCRGPIQINNTQDTHTQHTCARKHLLHHNYHDTRVRSPALIIYIFSPSEKGTPPNYLRRAKKSNQQQQKQGILVSLYSPNYNSNSL